MFIELMKCSDINHIKRFKYGKIKLSVVTSF